MKGFGNRNFHCLSKLVIPFEHEEIPSLIIDMPFWWKMMTKNQRNDWENLTAYMQSLWLVMLIQLEIFRIEMSYRWNDGSSGDSADLVSRINFNWVIPLFMAISLNFYIYIDSTASLSRLSIIIVIYNL